MIFLKLFESFTESNRASLYHTAPLSNAINILKEDQIWPSFGYDEKKRTISFTRDKNFTYGKRLVTFVLDQEKLRNKYRLRPFNYYVHGPDNPKKDKFEAEELMYGYLKDLHKYLTGIRINTKYKKISKTYDERQDYQKLVDILGEYTKKYSIPVLGDDWNSISIDSIKDLAA